MEGWKARKKIAVFAAIVILLITFSAVGIKESKGAKYTDSLPRMEDTEFRENSGIKIDSVNNVQQKNLYCLAKIWGYTKYRHPKITSGQINWDAELFRIMPTVLKSATLSEAQDSIMQWLEKFPVEPVEKSMHMKKKQNRLFSADLDWIRDEDFVGKDISRYLVNLSEIEVTDTQNGYVRFDFDDVYVTADFSPDNGTGINMAYDDSGMRLLSLFRYWNAIEYYYPYKRLLDKQWDSVLYDKIPELAEGKDEESYILAMANLVASIQDSHAMFLDEKHLLQDYFGEYMIDTRIVSFKNKLVVAQNTKGNLLQYGDIILKINGESIENRIKLCRKYISASNVKHASKIYAPYLLAAKNETINVQITRKNKTMNIDILGKHVENSYARMNCYTKEFNTGLIDNGKIGYLDMEGLNLTQLDTWMQKFSQTEGVIVDLRYGGPTFSIYTLAEYFQPEIKTFAYIYGCDYLNPGSFKFQGKLKAGNGFLKQLISEADNLTDILTFNKYFENGIINSFLGRTETREVYAGEVIVLVGEWTMSKYETAVMALKNAPKLTVFGNATAGANGDVVELKLPGGITTYFSGKAVTDVKEKTTQRAGIQPDIEYDQWMSERKIGEDAEVEAAVDLIKRNTTCKK